MNQALPNHRNKIYGGAWPVPDPEVLEYLMTNSSQSNHEQFVKDYFEWFAQPHAIEGIESFNSLSYCNGTTEAFDKFCLLSRRDLEKMGKKSREIIIENFDIKVVKDFYMRRADIILQKNQ